MFTLSYTKNGAPQRHPLRQGATLVGRSPECDLLLDDVSISRRHAVFEVSADRCAIRDLGSSNGTYRNGVVVTGTELDDGDTVTLGQLPVQVHKSLDDHLTLTDNQVMLDGDATLYRSVVQVGAAGAL